MISNKYKILVTLTLIIVVSIFFFSFYLNKSTSPPPNLDRLALVGDSITQITSYPSQLEALISDNFTIGNFGASGTTVNLASIEPYLNNCSIKSLQDFQPTTVVVMLGTNDARSDVYPLIESFVNDYKQLISFLQSLDSAPQIFLVIPPPVNNNTISINSTDYSLDVIPRIEQVATEMGLPLIDVYSNMLNRPDYFVDGVHPNHEGAKIIAETIFKQIT